MNALTTDLSSTVRARYPFSVDRFPLSGPDGMATPWYGLFRSDTGRPVGPGSVTGRYTPHTTDDVIALVDAASSAFSGVTQLQCGWDDGHYLIAQPSDQERHAIYGSDVIWPRLFISAPYGGRGSFRASLGWYRDLCRNLSRMRSVHGVSVTIRHTHSLRSRMDELIATFGGLRDAWSQTVAAVERMSAKTVNMADFLIAVYGTPAAGSGRSVTVHRQRTEAIFRRLTSERMRTGRGEVPPTWEVTGWEAFNAVQGFVQHDSRRRGRPTMLDRVVLAERDAAVARAEELALAV